MEAVAGMGITLKQRKFVRSIVELFVIILLNLVDLAVQESAAIFTITKHKVVRVLHIQDVEGIGTIS